MGTIVVTEFVTLDGVMEAPGGEPTHRHSGWVGDYFGPQVGEYKLKEVLEAEAQLLGRVTYESFAGAWPQRDDPQGFAAKMNAMPKYVVTSTLDALEWNNSTRLEGDVVAAVTQLKEQVEGIILVAGSGTLVHTLVEHDLVDELRLMVFPVAIGSGLRVLPETDKKTALELVHTAVLDDVVQVNHYRPA
jgi:dihydrofolate reductase